MGEQAEYEERPCKCKCGQTFRARVSDPRRLFVNTIHANRFYRERDADGEIENAAIALQTKRANGKMSALVREADRLRTRVDELETLLDRYSFIKPEDTRVPAWLRSKKKTRAHRATPVLLLSDLHLDEVVDLAAMDGVNEYSREVAHQRFDRVINGSVDLLKNYRAGTHWDGIVAAFLGDILTGVIHDELARTNEAPPSASIVHWVPVLCSGLVYLADELGRVHAPCVDGNHDRFYKQTPAKQRATSSLAWVVYNWMADHLRGDDRITFSITESDEQLIDVYDTTLLLSHGDAFRSQGGVGGLYPAMLKWLLRRHQFYSATKRDFDLACIGHWHTDLYGPDFVVNNSLKGYDEYAKKLGFTFGRPGMQLFAVTPERGMSWRDFVHAD